MIDPHATIRTFLAAQSDITDLTGARIYAGRDVPPEGYTPADGACVVFKVRGGGRDYEDALLIPSAQFKCYGATEQAAYACYRALADVLHGGYSATILYAEEEGMAALLEEPGTDWIYALAFFFVLIRTA